MYIDDKKYNELLDAQKKLIALENGGVDNWEWYSESLKDYFKEKEQLEIVQKYNSNIENFMENIFESICDNGIEYPCGSPEAGIGIKQSVQDYIKEQIQDLILVVLDD